MGSAHPAPQSGRIQDSWSRLSPHDDGCQPTTTTIRFPIFNQKNLELKTCYHVARLYPEHRSIHVEFSREEVSPGTPAGRWLVVTI